MPQGDSADCFVYLVPAGYFPSRKIRWQRETALSLDVIFRKIRLFTGTTEKLRETELLTGIFSQVAKYGSIECYRGDADVDKSTLERSSGHWTFIWWEFDQI